MRPEEYLAIVGRRWWLVALAAVAAVIGAFAYSASQPTTYQASTRIMAVAQPPDYWLDLYAKNRLASYKDLIDNWEFVAGALQQAGLDGVEPGAAMNGLTLGHNPDANTVQIVKTDTDPQRAADVVNALAEAFVGRTEAENAAIIERFPTADTSAPRGTVEMIKLETPSAPTTPIGPRTRLNMAAGLLLGLIFGIMLTFGVEYFDDTLRNERDVTRYLELPTIAGIPRG